MSIFNGFFDNLLNGALSPKGDMADYAHASRLFVDNKHRLTPKTKYLYHVSFNLNETVVGRVLPGFTGKHGNEVNMLVKSVDLPKYKITTETKNMYNRKKNLQTRIDYDPINISFHDDNLGIVTLMWEGYYRYYYRDGNYGSLDGAGRPNQTSGAYSRLNTYQKQENFGRYGFDNDSYEPFFTSIQISQLARHEYTTFTLVNPIVSDFQHDTMDSSLGAEPAANQMTVLYETVFYARGGIEEGNAPKGFATEHYDKTPSPISIAGGGTASLFGQGGVLAGAGSVFGDITSGNIGLGTIIKGVNTVRNAKELTKEGIRNEGFAVLGDTIRETAGVNVSGLANSSFPKNGGSGTTTTNATPVTTVKATKRLGATQILGGFATNQTLLESSVRKAYATGVIGDVANGVGTFDTLDAADQEAFEAEFVQLIQNGDIKAINIASNVIVQYKELNGDNVNV
jgi:hypothetical protein